MSLFRASILIIILAVASVLTAQPEGEYQWQNVEPMDQARSGHASVVYDGEIYVFGGQNSRRQTLRSLEIYNPHNDSWRAGPRMPRPLSYHTAVVAGDHIFIFGGSSDPGRPEVGIIRFSPDEGDDRPYHRVRDMSEPRYNTNAVVVNNGTILVMGGISNHVGGLETGFYFDLDDYTISEAPEFNDARANFGLVNYRVPIAVGGINFGAVSSIETLVDDQWARVGRMEIQRGLFGTVVYGDTIMIVGGFGGQRPMPQNMVNGFVISDRGRFRWNRFQSMNQRRADHSLVTLDGSIYAIGGNATMMDVTNEVEKYGFVPVSVKNEAKPIDLHLISVFPNPTNGLVTFSFPYGFDAIRIVNASGRALYEQKGIEYINRWSWNAHSMPTGNYYYIVESGKIGNSHTGRLVVIK